MNGTDKKTTSCLKYVFSSFTNCQEKERAEEFNCVKKEYFCASDLENLINDKKQNKTFVTARNASFYFEAEQNCENEKSVLVTTLEPGFKSIHLDKLKELTQYINIKLLQLTMLFDDNQILSTKRIAFT